MRRGGVNAARGEAALVAGGVTYRLCLTLGALAEIESALGVDGFAALGQRLARPRGEDLVIILAALLRGGGHDLSADDVRDLKVPAAEAVRAVAAALNAAMPKPDAE